MASIGLYQVAGEASGIPGEWIVGGGTVGLIAFLLLVVHRLASWHEREDKAREERLVKTEAREDVLVEAVRVSTETLKDLRDQERQRLERDSRAYDGPDRRGPR